MTLDPHTFLRNESRCVGSWAAVEALLLAIAVFVACWYLSRQIHAGLNHHWQLLVERDHTPDALHPVFSRTEIREVYRRALNAKKQARLVETNFVDQERELWTRGVPASREASDQMLEAASLFVSAENDDGLLDTMLSLNSRVFRGELTRANALSSVPTRGVFADIARRDEIVRDWSDAWRLTRPNLARRRANQ